MMNDDSKRMGWGLRIVGFVCLLAVLGGFVWLGWLWLSQVEVSDVRISGEVEASADSLVALSRVQIGEPLYELKPSFVADRVERHPWVKEAYVTRLPTGDLTIEVTEREPVLLALQSDEGPVFIDDEGYQMPWNQAPYDVPLLTGLTIEYRPLNPLDHPMLRAFLTEFVQSETTEVISEVDISDDGIRIYTISGETHGAIPVELGHTHVGERLEALSLFWNQAVKGQPDKQFERVDLRYEGQVIAQERGAGTVQQ